MVLALFAVMIAAIGLAYWALRGPDEPAPDRVTAAAPPSQARASHASSGHHAPAPSERPSSPSQAHPSAVAPIGPHVVLPPGTATPMVTPDDVSRIPPAGANGRPTIGELEQAQSAGWRLGATRRRIALLEGRIQRVQDSLDELERTGRTDLMDRQSSVLDRYAMALEQLREDEPRLAEQARNDGTLDDAAQGFDEAEAEGRAASGGAANRAESAPP
ncbi:MAG: hypothetical protein AB7P00_21590 [Sandaracinaceae bacterium]